jgi:hypothetical protein
MKGFRFNIVALLSKFEPVRPTGKLIPLAVRRDLFIWKNFVQGAVSGFPLGDLFDLPPLRLMSFVSDAAGAAWEQTEKGRKNCSIPGDRGAAAIWHYKGKAFQ